MHSDNSMDRPAIEQRLRETRADRLADLWQRADETRRREVGDEVHLRGLVEISNHCTRRCRYCGIHADNRTLPRYRMRAEEILEAAQRAAEFKYGTVVLQAGEDPALDRPFIANVIRRLKEDLGLAVTLSLGERNEGDLAAWREAGADRYLLRFETSRRDLFERIHPRGPHSVDRFEQLAVLRRLGYETGSGVMIGIPGQTFADLARSLARFAELDLDMIGVGPFIAHPDTDLGRGAADCPPAPESDQVPPSERMAYKVLALTRLVRPDANIPSTTAISTLDEHGRELGLERGANVIMPNLTPMRYRRLYEIYPAKSCLAEDPATFDAELKRRLRAIGRVPGRGRGDRVR
ncbi:[FeFe] hydrogenase H-cluster radical SAM maturase HydE [Kiritimatiella glycovorans]|uniref:Biotin synthase n=1 Tax=Kiritimatiella glycovorans TaxID=1307763 RepID=A0A0G3ELQ4_9BACT|nr:[FeFe] hydrogenase H-cluster radical SAM maturase HydE [Kiritimatiella glycovorans]AKJ65094.1 Biotin synthase [Kiritimatiella glycovorans]